MSRYQTGDLVIYRNTNEFCTVQEVYPYRDGPIYLVKSDSRERPFHAAARHLRKADENTTTKTSHFKML